ncbi:MAG: histidine kinase, partial [bacterium]|nr:histidine kinase [bacterium]
FTAFDTVSGLPSDVVYGILEDDQARLWIATKEGLSRLDPTTRTFTTYNHSDGLLSYPFSRNACLKSGAGEMYFGGTNGFSRFLPREVKDNPEIPPVVLTEFEVFNRPVVPGMAASSLERDITEARRIRLRYDQSVFSLAFSALNYRAPDKNRYAYKLEGFDRDWSAPGAQRTVTYTNLDPG